jgi:hypothetical protein
MKAMNKTAVRPTDRVNQTVAALARLLDQMMNDIQVLDSEIQEQESAHERTLAEADEGAAIALDMQISNALNRLRAELTEQWDAERAVLVGDRNRAQQRLADVASDHERQLAEATNNLRSQLAEEIEGLRRQLEEAQQTSAAAEVAASTRVSSKVGEAVQAEIVRVEGMILEISQIVDSPQTDLSIVIRKNVERAELQSYLRGLRFISSSNSNLP